MAQQRGANLRAEIAGVPYAVQRCNVAGDVQPVVVSNSEGVPGDPLQPAVLGTSAVIPDLPEGTVELVSATFDTAANPFEAPLNLQIGDYYALLIFPAGAGFFYNYGNCLLLHFDHASNIPGPQPVTLRFRTDGVFTIGD